MEFGPDDGQQELVRSFAGLLADRSDFEAVRAAEPVGFDAALWDALFDTGVVTMAVPEEADGWGASLLDLALVAEQVGRATASAPVVETQVAARLLAACGETAEASLKRVLAGDQVVTLAVRPARGSRCELVPAGAVCDALVALHGSELRIAEVGEANRATVANLASAPLADVDCDGAAEHEVLVEGAGAAGLFERALDEWLVLTAAAVVGIAAVALERTCEYASQRRAFGSAIGSFQGVAHPLADDATAIDGARLLAHKAAWSLDHDRERSRELAAMAFAFATGTAAKATYDAVHFHGGYGFMAENDLQLLYRRARGWPRVWGDARTANRRVAAARYGGC